MSASWNHLLSSYMNKLFLMRLKRTQGFPVRSLRKLDDIRESECSRGGHCGNANSLNTAFPRSFHCKYFLRSISGRSISRLTHFCQSCLRQGTAYLYFHVETFNEKGGYQFQKKEKEKQKQYAVWLYNKIVKFVKN